MNIKINDNSTVNFTFSHKVLIIITSLSAMLVIASDLLTYKLFSIDELVGSASLIIFPITYLLSGIITELYGKKIAKFVFYMTLISEFLLDVGVGYIIHLPSPLGFHTQVAYDQVIGTLPGVYWGAFIALIVSSLINIRLMSTLKQRFNGKWYLLRSFCSTMIGLMSFTMIGYTIWFWGIKSPGEVIELIIVSVCFKLIVVIVMVSPVSLLVKWLKKRI